jgi:O-antigen/teichoic acid export membrane protein
MHAREEHGRSEALFQRADRYVMAVTACVAAMLLGAGPRLLEAWLGRHDPQADIALVGLVLAAVFALATSTAAVMVRSAGRTDLEAGLSAVAFGTHLLAALVLVPRFQLLGAVAATLLGNVVGGLTFLARVAAVMRWSRVRTMLGGWAAPSLAMAAGMLAGRLLVRFVPEAGGVLGWAYALALAAASALVCVVVIALTRAITLTELRALAPGRMAS